MDWIIRYCSSSIGRKQLLALSGAGLLGFLVAHLAGNLLFFAGPDVFNKYSHMLISNPALPLAEAGLLGIFVVHVILAIKLSAENKMARPTDYAASLCAPYSRFTAKTMIFTGLLTAVFIVFHIVTMKFGPYYETVVEGHKIRDLYLLMVETFTNYGYLGFYVFCMIVLGFHLNHGFWSACQTLGLNHPRYNHILHGLSGLLSFGLAGGFALVAIFASFQGGH